MSTWAPVPGGSGFGLENLPLGVVQPTGDTPRVAARIGDHALDLAAAGVLPSLTMQPSLNALLLEGAGDEARWRARDVLLGPAREDWLWPLEGGAVKERLPVAVGDYVDFYSSRHHAENLGRILRPGTDPLPANWRHLPAGYHGRAGTVVVSGTPVARPWGLVATGEEPPRLRPTAMLDIELEVGFVVSGARTARVRPDDAHRHVFGVVLLDDWSARDIQAFEYQPLGPHLGKSFATTISAWVVSLEALAPFLVAPRPQDPVPDRYLLASRPWGLDLQLSVELNGTEVPRPSFAGMYWTFAQQLAHLTVNGATTAAGDLFGSGTVSGPERHQRGSLIELTWRGAEPLVLADGTTRSFLLDGDTVVLRGGAGGPDGAPRIELGECRGTITPGAPPAGLEEDS